MRRGDSVLVGVSGGPDSMCLLDILCSLAKPYNLSLRVAHVNYRLRGADSDSDEILVKKRCEQWSVPLETFHADTSSRSKDENTLRVIRYTFFRSIAHKHGIRVIAVGHTKNDQAETVLLRLIRGAGLRGLSGMQLENNGIIRPLLEISRDEVMAYLEERSIPYRLDKTNLDTRYTRNRIRHEVLPSLALMNPNIIDVLARQTHIANAQKNYFEKMSGEESRRLFVEIPGQGWMFSARAFLELPTAMQSYVIFSHLRNHGVDNPEDFAQFQQLRKMVASDKNKIAKKTFFGLKFTKQGDTVCIHDTYND